MKQIFLLVLISLALISTNRTSLAATAAKQTGAGLAASKTQEKSRAGDPAKPQTTGKTASTSKKVSSAERSNKNQVMAPDKFFGQAAIGYAAAKQCPEICAKLFCYCGCDHVDGHHSLLDCFTCEHGADCQICQEEAIDALRLKHEGKSLGEIQKYVDKHYAKQYFLLDLGLSPALKKYRANRLYKTDAKSDPVPQGKPENSSAKVRTNTGSIKKPGGKGCCAGKKSR